MIDVICKYLADNYPEITGILILVIVVSYITVKVYSFYIKTKHVCDSHPDLKKKLDLLLEKFNSLITVLSENSAIKNPELFSTNSPVHLTEKGVDFIKSMEWDKILEDGEQKGKLFASLDKLHLKTKADVEKYCLVMLTEMYGARDENPFTKVKEYLYENASINRQNAIFACSIYLRDKYLEEHQNIK
jgi:hypothetical protein